MMATNEKPLLAQPGPMMQKVNQHQGGPSPSGFSRRLPPATYTVALNFTSTMPFCQSLNRLICPSLQPTKTGPG